MLSLILAAITFMAIHIGVSGTTLRDRLTAAVGLNGYMIAFSVASVAAIVWLVSAYNSAEYQPTWGQLEWWKPAQIVLMLPAFLLVVIGLTTPNPTSVAQEALAAQPPRGIVRITRHPFLVGVFIWAAVHLVGNGDVASLLFFASLAIVAAAGTVSIDAKRRRLLGRPCWDTFARQTSIIPFAAILDRRAALDLAASAGGALSPATVAFALMLGGHAHLVGVNPFPAWWRPGPRVGLCCE